MSRDNIFELFVCLKTRCHIHEMQNRFINLKFYLEIKDVDNDIEVKFQIIF
jgi:hypothetical protein